VGRGRDGALSRGAATRMMGGKPEKLGIGAGRSSNEDCESGSGTRMSGGAECRGGWGWLHMRKRQGSGRAALKYYQGRAEDAARGDGLPVAPPAQPDGRAGRHFRVVLVRRELVAGPVDLDVLQDRPACAPNHSGWQARGACLCLRRGTCSLGNRP
jgi:hypothetical protein